MCKKVDEVVDAMAMTGGRVVERTILAQKYTSTVIDELVENIDATDELMQNIDATDGYENSKMSATQQLKEIRGMKHQSFLRETGSPKQFEWEKHSSGAARKTLERMGYSGRGLGRHEDGIEEANTVNKIEKSTLIFSTSIVGNLIQSLTVENL